MFKINWVITILISVNLYYNMDYITIQSNCTHSLLAINGSIYQVAYLRVRTTYKLDHIWVKPKVFRVNKSNCLLVLTYILVSYYGQLFHYPSYYYTHTVSTAIVENFFFSGLCINYVFKFFITLNTFIFFRNKSNSNL